MTLTLISNLLILGGLIVSIFLGNPVSRLKSGRAVLGLGTNERQAKVHDIASWAGVTITGIGVGLSIYVNWPAAL